MAGPISNYWRVAAATVLGLPAVGAAYLRIKYGPTVADDIVTLYTEYKILKTLLKMQKEGVFMVDIFELQAKMNPDKTFVLYRDEVYSYRDMDQESNRLARYIHTHSSLNCKDTAAILMTNEPAFITTWLAFSKLGLKLSLLNYNTKSAALLHCIKACKVKAIMCGKDDRLLDALEPILPDLQQLGIQVWAYGITPASTSTSTGHKKLPPGVSRVTTWNEQSEPIPKSLRAGIDFNDVSVYIFTSGTTGFPKPAKVSHYRSAGGAVVVASLLDIKSTDTFYITLPLYHSLALGPGLMSVIFTGSTIALETFSPQVFWSDVRKYKANVVFYIGETCRYLLAQPKRPDDGKYNHIIKAAFGLGLQPDIWQEFQRRFNIEQIYEVYGATECPFMSVNMDDKVGSVGRQSPLERALVGVIEVVKCDVETAEPLHDDDGMCILADPGETGLMVTKVDDMYRFDGYMADHKTNEKKLVQNVKKKGDVYFNSGDLMMIDREGFLYFRDRLGDTFRWKGENVSTTEVAQVLNDFPGIMESNVYGVVVAGKEGRAGMAAVVLDKDTKLDPKGLYDHVVAALPLYACPKFVRVTGEMSITSTFKHKKADLVREGFDVNLVSDPLYFLDVEQKTYVPLDRDVLQKIAVGKARL